MRELFNKMMKEDDKFKELVNNNYEITAHLIMNTDLNWDQISEMEDIATEFMEA